MTDKSPVGFCPRCRKAIFVPFIDHYDRCHPKYQSEPVDGLDRVGRSLMDRISVAARVGTPERVDELLREKDKLNHMRMETHDAAC